MSRKPLGTYGAATVRHFNRLLYSATRSVLSGANYAQSGAMMSIIRKTKALNLRNAARITERIDVRNWAAEENGSSRLTTSVKDGMKTLLTLRAAVALFAAQINRMGEASISLLIIGMSAASHAGLAINAAVVSYATAATRLFLASNLTPTGASRHLPTLRGMHA